MSIDRYQGWSWLTCDNAVAFGCDKETEAVMGDIMEAKERGRLEGWAVGNGSRGRDLCPMCKPLDPPSVSP